MIPDYTLSPNTDYNGMAKQIAVNGLKIVVNSKVIQMKFYHRTFSRGHWAHWPYESEVWN
jgi:hypothetical protein